LGLAAQQTETGGLRENLGEEFLQILSGGISTGHRCQEKDEEQDWKKST